jgi:FMN phosphatase YigB (HAD superfamily)
MITSILFDLDGTLLENDMERFMPSYLAALSRRLAPVVPGDTLVSALMAATRSMMKPHDRAKTNEEVFWADFLPRLRCSREDVLPLLDEFYHVDFATLRELTSPMPGASVTVHAAFTAGLTVAIATQPVFPLTAIEQRLQWAGVDGLPYALVTSFEIMHATKPDPAYYREVCQRIGHSPSACLMVGNDPDADIRPARAAGLHTFLLAGQGEEQDPDLHAEHRGTLHDLHQLVSSLHR